MPSVIYGRRVSEDAQVSRHPRQRSDGTGTARESELLPQQPPLPAHLPASLPSHPDRLANVACHQRAAAGPGTFAGAFGRSAPPARRLASSAGRGLQREGRRGWWFSDPALSSPRFPPPARRDRSVARPRRPVRPGGHTTAGLVAEWVGKPRVCPPREGDGAPSGKHGFSNPRPGPHVRPESLALVDRAQ